MEDDKIIDIKILLKELKEIENKYNKIKQSENIDDYNWYYEIYYR